MKIKLILPLIFAAALPALALASADNNETDHTFSQQLAQKTSTGQARGLKADNIHGQSDAMTQAFAQIEKNTARPTAIRSGTAYSSTNGKPLDW